MDMRPRGPPRRGRDGGHGGGPAATAGAPTDDKQPAGHRKEGNQ